MKKEDKLLIRNKDESATCMNSAKNVIKLGSTTVRYALSWMLSISVYRIRKNATFIKKRVI